MLEDLEYAIEKGNAYLLRNMLTLKDLTGARSFVAYSNVGRDSRTLLHSACIARERECVVVLLKAGADPNAVGTLGPFGLLASGTPLYVAAANGHTKVVAALLKAGANPKRASYLGPLYARTPMEVAASHDHTGTVEVLRSAIDAK